MKAYSESGEFTYSSLWVQMEINNKLNTRETLPEEGNICTLGWKTGLRPEPFRKRWRRKDDPGRHNEIH
jgi:hypothetical protein